MVTTVTKWDLITEADFAKHFLLYNRALLNVGYCPVAGPRGLHF